MIYAIKNFNQIIKRNKSSNKTAFFLNLYVYDKNVTLKYIN